MKKSWNIVLGLALAFVLAAATSIYAGGTLGELERSVRVGGTYTKKCVTVNAADVTDIAVWTKAATSSQFIITYLTMSSTAADNDVFFEVGSTTVLSTVYDLDDGEDFTFDGSLQDPVYRGAGPFTVTTTTASTPTLTLTAWGWEW